MPTTTPIHLVVMQPTGYIHSLGLLDPARYLQHQLRRLGATVTLAKNRLREDAINIVFGAHLGFAPALRQRHTCLFFNLEQLGDGGAMVRPEYLDLLRKSAVVDYDNENLASYRSNPRQGMIVPLGHAPYLDQGEGIALEDRPIDLLFFGSLNARRMALLERIEASGTSVSVFDQVLYGPERDQFIRQAKAVLNCHFYDASRFEQVRASHCLSLGTPVISERRPKTRPPAAFEQSVSWFDHNSLEGFFRNDFKSPAFFEKSRRHLALFRLEDPIDCYAQLLRFATDVHQKQIACADRTTARPTHLMLGAGNLYQPAWFNVDATPSSAPDLVLDLGAPLQLPIELPTTRGGMARIEAGQLQMIRANDMPARVGDLGRLMENAMLLLSIGGEIEIEVPYARVSSPLQEPGHIRTINEHSWTGFTEQFWRQGWFECRFETVAATRLDSKLQPCSKDAATKMQVRLRKVTTSPHERTIARSMATDFGHFDEEQIDLYGPEQEPCSGANEALLAA